MLGSVKSGSWGCVGHPSWEVKGFQKHQQLSADDSQFISASESSVFRIKR